MARKTWTVGLALAALGLMAAGCSRNTKTDVPLTTLSSGLKYADLVVGTGAEAKPGSTVSVNYIGWLQSGIVFDSRLDKNQPVEFRLVEGSQIPGTYMQIPKGWVEGISGMHVGGKRKLVIPPDLAYGAQGSPPKIPPFEELTFEIELLGVK